MRWRAPAPDGLPITRTGEELGRLVEWVGEVLGMRYDLAQLGQDLHALGCRGWAASRLSVWSMRQATPLPRPLPAYLRALALWVSSLEERPSCPVNPPPPRLPSLDS